ncbi:mitotic checkpoint regulator, MAD2B-interacting-domain-containing protein [Mycena floridula]|nr:mitotic checkpoint regulator, MAD2B-interacting-domain-containing protein [Mycena floridula]
MLGLEGYGSGSDNESGTEVSKPTIKAPVPKPKKKVIIGLPSLKSAAPDDLEDERPPAKKPRLAGSGASSLLSMLPTPKQKQLTPTAAPVERVLGGGSGPGLVFDQPEKAPSLMLPPSLMKGKANISLEDGSKSSKPKPETVPVLDLFSLGSLTTPKPTIASTTSKVSLPAISSAPVIPTYEPPEPTPNDEYPGYYQLPSGKWEMYDPEYYAKFSKKWQFEYNAHVRALEKGTAKGFEDLDKSVVAEVDAQKEMERAKQEIKLREERKAVTHGAAGGPAMPNMRITASKQSGVARARHQLGTMLMEAYQNREALEEKIAEGRRNRKESGNKYGF